MEDNEDIGPGEVKITHNLRRDYLCSMLSAMVYVFNLCEEGLSTLQPSDIVKMPVGFDKAEEFVVENNDFLNVSMGSKSISDMNVSMNNMSIHISGGLIRMHNSNLFLRCFYEGIPKLKQLISSFDWQVN